MEDKCISEGTHLCPSRTVTSTPAPCRALSMANDARWLHSLSEYRRNHSAIHNQQLNKVSVWEKWNIMKAFLWVTNVQTNSVYSLISHVGHVYINSILLDSQFCLARRFLPFYWLVLHHQNRNRLIRHYKQMIYVITWYKLSLDSL